MYSLLDFYKLIKKPFSTIFFFHFKFEYYDPFDLISYARPLSWTKVLKPSYQKTPKHFTCIKKFDIQSFL